MSDESSWTYRLAAGLYAGRWSALAVAVLVTMGAVVPALQVGVDTAVQHWFTEGDPALETYRDFQDTYGNDEVVLIGLHRDDGLFTPEGIATLRTATERVRAVDGVASVTSLTTQRRPLRSLTGVQLVPLVPSGSLSTEQAQAVWKHVRGDSTFARLANDDGTMAAVYARMKRNATIDGRRGAILDSVRHALTPLDASVHLAGTGVILDALNEAATQDAVFLVLASGIVIFLLLWGYFRRLGPVLLTLGVVGVATIWLMGTYGLAGKNVNMLTLVMPTLVLVVGTADCVHLLVHAADLPDDLAPRERTVQTLHALAAPCLVTTLTTAAGFASLTTSSMSIVRDLGLFSAAGVLFSLVVAFVGCAVALSYDAMLPNRPSDAWLQRVVDGTVRLGFRRWQSVLGGMVLTVVIAGVGVTLLDVDTNPIGYFFADHPVRQDSQRIEREIGSYAPLEFVVRADASAMQPDLLRAVGRWQNRATDTGMVQWHRSPVDDLRRLHATLPGGSASVPSSPNRLRGLLQLAPDELTYLEDLRAHPDRIRVTFGVPIQSADGLRRTIDTVRAVAHLPDGTTIEPTGYLPLYVRMMTLLSDSLVRSFGLALLVIVGVIGLFFRSVPAALLSLVPNGLPVLVVLGLMGGLAIPLDVGTMTIAAIVFGLVVDDTIHVLHRYTEARDGSSAVHAMQQSARQAGRRMAITTSVLAGGFLVLGLAEITSVVWLGLLSAVAIAVALAADLLVLPAVVAGARWSHDED